MKVSLQLTMHHCNHHRCGPRAVSRPPQSAPRAWVLPLLGCGTANHVHFHRHSAQVAPPPRLQIVVAGAAYSSIDTARLFSNSIRSTDEARCSVSLVRYPVSGVSGPHPTRARISEWLPRSVAKCRSPPPSGSQGLHSSSAECITLTPRRKYSSTPLAARGSIVRPLSP